MTKDEAYAQADEEENIEDSGVIEKTEWIGQIQKPVKPIPEEVEIEPIAEIKPIEDDANKGSIDKVLDGIREKLPSVPGLDVNDLVEKFIDSDPILSSTFKVYQAIIDNKDGLFSEKDVETAKNNLRVQRENMIKQYKEEFNKSVDIIKSCYKEISEGIVALVKTIKEGIEGMLQPDVIVAGSATGVPNPIKEKIKISQLKTTATIQLNQLTTSSVTLLHESAKIGFVLPEVVLESINGLTTLSSTIKLIPV